MSVSHLPLKLENFPAVGVGKAPPVDLDHFQVRVLSQVLLTNVTGCIHIASMASEEYQVPCPVLDELSNQKVQIVLQDLAGHRERAGEGLKCRGLTRLDGGSDEGTGLFRYQLSNSFGHNQIRAHGQVRTIDLAGPSRNDHSGTLLHTRQVLFSAHFSDIICHNLYFLSDSTCGFWNYV